MATLSRNLAELQSTKSMCIYELPSTPSFYSQVKYQPELVLLSISAKSSGLKLGVFSLNFWCLSVTRGLEWDQNLKDNGLWQG